MKNSTSLSKTASVKIPNWLIGLLLLSALVGFSDASFLTGKYYAGEIPPCGAAGCEEVLTSQYATVGPIPIALLGVIYYLAVFILFFHFWTSGKVSSLKLGVFISAVGFLISLSLIYLQLFVIEAICLYCLISAVASTCLFSFGLFALRHVRQNGNKE